MKKPLILFAVMTIGTSLSQALEPIQLSSPDLNRGTCVMKAFGQRHSERAFDEKNLALNDLSDLLWAANGVNRPDGRRTAPSALNKQDIDIYAFTREGAYRYDAATRQLVSVAEGDHRQLVVGAQADFPLAPVFLVMVSDLSRFGDTVGERAIAAGNMDGAIVSQNISLFCAGCGMVTVPRMTMDTEGLRNLLGLSDHHLFVINNPVGYPVKN